MILCAIAAIQILSANHVTCDLGYCFQLLSVTAPGGKRRLFQHSRFILVSTSAFCVQSLPVRRLIQPSVKTLGRQRGDAIFAVQRGRM